MAYSSVVYELDPKVVYFLLFSLSPRKKHFSTYLFPSYIQILFSLDCNILLLTLQEMYFDAFYQLAIEATVMSNSPMWH